MQTDLVKSIIKGLLENNEESVSQNLELLEFLEGKAWRIEPETKPIIRDIPFPTTAALTFVGCYKTWEEVDLLKTAAIGDYVFIEDLKEAAIYTGSGWEKII